MRRGSHQTRMKLSGDSDEHWQASWRDLSVHLPWQPVVLAAATTTQRVSLCSTPWPRHRPPSRRRIANDWHSTQTSAPFVSRLGQSAATDTTSFLDLPTDALVQDRRTSVSSNCMQYLRTHEKDEQKCRRTGCNKMWPIQCFVIISITNRSIKAKILTSQYILSSDCYAYYAAFVYADFVCPYWQFISKIFSTTTSTESCYRNARAEKWPAIKQLFGYQITIIELIWNVCHIKCSKCPPALATHACTQTLVKVLDSPSS